ncbi:unnamed protein product [Calypogeia fissa]
MAALVHHSASCLQRGFLAVAAAPTTSAPSPSSSSATTALFGRSANYPSSCSSSSSICSSRERVCFVLSKPTPFSSSTSPSACSTALPSYNGVLKRSRNGRWAGGARAMAAVAPAAVAAAPSSAAGDQVRPSPAEAARTVVDICTEGTLSTLSEDEWPTATAVRFSLDAEGNPVFRFSASALHTRNLAADNRSSLHVQLELPGRRRPQCTLRGRIQKIDSAEHVLKLDFAWEKRFGQERVQEDEFYVMNVEQALYAQDMGEEEVWVSGTDFSAAVADPLRECAAKIVEDMNRKHWEDVRRFCNSHARLNVEVEEASMTWVDRLGFDLRVLTRSPQSLLEVRIPFSREVSDERDARSSLTMMAQVAWEHERNYSPPDVQLLGSFNVSS